MSWDPGKRDDTVYRVVVNGEQMYSIWPAHREVPLGWSDTGFTGSKDECLEHIKLVWPDARAGSRRDADQG